MSEKAKHDPKLHGVTAEFDSVDSLLAASERVRDAGYTLTDAFTPFPVHGIDKALGIKPTALPWITLAGGLTGCFIGLAMQIWMNGIDYPYIISGKPYISMPAFIPVSFELTILLASFGSFFGMLALNKLPKFSNPVFTNPRFDRATDDRFFLYVDAKDARFELEGVRRLLSDCSPLEVADVVEDQTPTVMPRLVVPVIGFLALFAIVPALLVVRMRVTRSESPRFHVFYDMDFAPSKDAQEVTTIFADGRAMRPDVPGTVARGQLGYDIDFQTGIDMEALAKLDPVRAARLVGTAQEPSETGDDPEEPQPAEGNDGGPEQPAVVEEIDPAPPADAEGEEADSDSGEPNEPAQGEADNQDATPAEPEETAAEPQQVTADEQPTADEEPMTEERTAASDDGETQAEEQSPGTTTGGTPVEDDDPAEPTAAPTEPGEAQPEEALAAGPAVADNTPWLEKNPREVNTALLETGREQFNIYCAVCHGVNGTGNGLVSQRAQRILSQWWVPPTSLHDENLQPGSYPDGKIFSVITHGIRKMPAYGSQIPAAKRWAVVAYVRALQRSQNADPSDVPADHRETLLQEQQAVQAELERAAQEAEAEQQQTQQEQTQQKSAEAAATESEAEPAGN